MFDASGRTGHPATRKSWEDWIDSLLEAAGAASRRTTS